jgi:hypothetical protein
MKFKTLSFAPQAGAPERCTQATSASKRSTGKRCRRSGFTLYLCIGAILAPALPALASAQDSAQVCAGIHDDAERLACYDRRFGSPRSPSKSASSESAGESSRADQSKKDFSFSATVTAIERRGDKFVVTFANEQVWAQTEVNTRIEVRVGDTVRIRRGALGSYLLSNEAGIATRVRRVR